MYLLNTFHMPFQVPKPCSESSVLTKLVSSVRMHVNYMQHKFTSNLGLGISDLDDLSSFSVPMAQQHLHTDVYSMGLYY
jgi:hypothetical protein